MDAPLTSLEDRVVSDVAQQVSDGDIGHKLLTVMLGIIGATLFFKHRKRLRVYAPVAILFGTYLAWTCLGALTADDPELTIRRLGGFVLSLIFCVGCAARMDLDTSSLFVAGIPVLTLLPDVIAELKSHGLEALTADGRFGGTYPHPNVAAACLAVPVVIFFWLTVRTRGPARTIFACAGLTTGAFFVLTRSRTSILAVLAALAFSIVIALLRNQRLKLARLAGVLLLAIGLTGLAGLAAYSSPGGLNLLSALHSNRDEGDPTTLTGRVDLWKTCLEYAYERPLLGFGFGGFWSAKHIESISEEQKWPINQSHNGYLDEVLNLGFPGSVLHIAVLLGCIAVCTGRFFRYDTSYGIPAALLVFITVHSFTEAISLSPGYLNFVMSLIAVQIALVKPIALENRLPREKFPNRIPVAMTTPVSGYARQAGLRP